MFSILAQNRRQGWQNFERKNWRGVSRDSFFSKFCHPRSRFWEPKFKTWSRQIMFYVIYPDPTCLPALIFYGRTACYDWTSKCPNKGIRVAYLCISYNLRLTMTFKINNALISMAITHHWLAWQLKRIGNWLKLTRQRQKVLQYWIFPVINISTNCRGTEYDGFITVISHVVPGGL